MESVTSQFSDPNYPDGFDPMLLEDDEPQADEYTEADRDEDDRPF